jgi:DNA adenine methylase
MHLHPTLGDRTDPVPEAAVATPTDRTLTRSAIAQRRAAAAGSSVEASLPSVVGPSPFLKWAGGKSRLLAQFEPFFPEHFERYHEPFLGGGAVFFHLRPEQASLSDLNGRLVACYRVIRDEPGALMERLDDHRRRHNRQYFYEARTRFNGARNMTDLDRAALFIYLNKTCFNGLYRENSRGEFNVPLGSYVDPAVYDPSTIEAVSQALQGVELRNEGFEGVAERAQAGDLVYFDPPYVPMSATSSFTNYTGAGFDLRLQERLAQLFDTLSRRGVYVMLSNSDTPVVRELFAGWRVESIRAGRSINSRGSGRGEVGEVLVCGW